MTGPRKSKNINENSEYTDESFGSPKPHSFETAESASVLNPLLALQLKKESSYMEAGIRRNQ